MIQPERRAAESNEFLERHPWLPSLLLTLLPIALRVPLWLLGRSTDPIWFFSGLTHSSSSLGKPFLDPNVGFTSEALGRLVAWDWLHGIVPWWNTYTGVGMPLAGELQPGAFFLPFNLLLLLPEGILWQQIFMQIIAGMATYALLRELGLSRLAAWMGGALFSLNGTIAWSPGPAAVYCTLPFLPLLLLGIELARRQQKSAASVLLIGVSTAWSILPGFPEPAYISSLPVLAWGLYRFASAPRRGALAGRAVAGLILGMLVTAPLLISFIDYIRQSNSFGLHSVGEEFLPGAAFSAMIMPYVYGSLTTGLNSIPQSHIWARIGGYTGVLIILLSVIGLSSRSVSRGLKFILFGWIFIAWGKTFGLRPIMVLMNHIPLMRQTNFFRFAPSSWELALIILAAFGLDDFLNRTPGRRASFGIAVALLAIGIILAWPQRAFWERPQDLAPVAFLLLALSVGWALTGLLAAYLSWRLLSGEWRRVSIACLLVFDAAIMFMVPQSSGTRGNSIDMPAMRFLSEHIGLSRFYTLGPIQPNYGAYFRVPNINHNVEPVPKLWADYVESNLLPGFSKIDSSETFWPGVLTAGEGERALSQHLASYLDLGVRYVVTQPGQSPAATVLLPAPDNGKQFGLSVGQSPAPRLTKLYAALNRCRSIAGDQAKPAVERFLAKAILKTGHLMVRGPSLWDVGQSANAEKRDEDSLPINSGESFEISVPAPSPVTRDSPITAVGIVIVNSGDAANGDLAVEICAGSVCRYGLASLLDSANKPVLQMPLDRPLAALTGGNLRLTFTHLNGSRPVVIQLATAGARQAQQSQRPNGQAAGQTIQLAFEYGLALPGLHKSYADSLMDIWELPNPAPYFQVIQGGPCSLLPVGRQEVTAECAAPSTLVRRELYMPGWRMMVNGTEAASVQQNGIFQSSILPAGRSQVLYRFTPPYMGVGWAAGAIGIAGLFWQVLLLAHHH